MAVHHPSTQFFNFFSSITKPAPALTKTHILTLPSAPSAQLFSSPFPPSVPRFLPLEGSRHEIQG